MPRMTHWNSPEPIDVPVEKAAVYAAQGWVQAGSRPTPKVQPAVVRDAPEGVVAEQPAKPTKKAPAKKSASSKSSK